MSDLFLGLDSSTQSLSAVVVDLTTRQIVHEVSLNFDKTLPDYGTQNGVLRSPDPAVVHAGDYVCRTRRVRIFSGHPKRREVHQLARRNGSPN